MNTRSARQTSVFKRLFIKFSVFMLVFGMLPFSQPSLTPATQAADSPCSAPVALLNGSFEEGPARGTANNGAGGFYFKEAEVPSWKTTDDAIGEKAIEIWNWKDNLPAGTKSYPAPPEGNRWAELNAFENGMLYQDVKTVPGQTIHWRLSHMGRSGVDTMQLRIGAATANPYDAVVQEQMSDGNRAWGTYTGSYTVPAGQTVTRFGFEAVSAVGGLGNGNFLDDIFLGTEPCVTSNKTVNPPGEVKAGSELTYTINVKNEGGDIAADATITDAIPAGTEYVPGSMVLNNGSATKNLTDANDTDEGDFDGNQINIKIGDLANTGKLGNGVTVQFKVKVLNDYAVKSVNNKAQVNYENLLTEEEEQTETNLTTTPITFPMLVSNKTVTLQEKASGNTDTEHPEVGDTLLYTIQTRNDNAGTTVKNLTISDMVPAELEYVLGSLTVDGKSVTDSEDDDAGHHVGGEVVGKLGDITDTNAHTVAFQAVVKPGQAGKDIINIAAVEGDNVDTPDRPREEVQVYPRNPQIESEKFASNVDASKATYEVGDTISYTIRARGVVNDTYLENLTITDTLPAGLQYVSGSLKVDGVSVSDAQDGDAGHSVSGEVYGSFGNVEDTSWHTLEFQAVIQDGQGGKTIQNTGKVTGDNINQPGEPTDKVVVEIPPTPPVDPPTDPQDPDDGGSGGGGGGSDDDDDNDSSSPKLESEKSAKDINGGSIEVGDSIEYTIRARNTVSNSSVTNMVISDDLPEELEYVPGTLKVDGATVTDSNDSDKGKYVDGTVTGSLGTVTNTDWHTVVFQAKLIAGQNGQTIRNTAEVTGDNLNNPDQPSEDIVVGGGSGSNSGVPGEAGNGPSYGGTNNPGWGGSDSGSTDSGQSGGSGGAGGTGQSDTSGDSVNGGNSGNGDGHGSKLPATATNMYGYLLAGLIILLAGLFLLRRKKA
ncbi:isopeptide-forming domain-containing fimbrial protein [Paenibacillus medicaginis]|uniref:Isopeptide-forming domain-containing fimbrial protein n=1 Tax=Paenibacillus medicaginis TaxID=1470560 RepID=A0ABV5C4B1_9BACL